MAGADVSLSAAAIPYSQIRELADLAMAMDDVIPLYFGESNLPTPSFVKDAAVRALAEGYTYYTANAGLPSLRAEIAAHYRRLHGVELDPATEIVVSASGVQALNVALRCVLDPGDEAIVLTPVWPNGPASVQMANATLVEVEQPVREGRYVIDLDAVEAALTPRTKAVLVTSPSNPLGWVGTDEELAALLGLCRRHGVWLFADEVYDRLYYRAEPGGAAPSILTHATRDDAVAVCHSLSKAYCMTGWRIGWTVARADLAREIAKTNEITISCAAGFVQKAAETALRDGEPWVRELVAGLRERRDLCVAALRTLPGVTVPEPDGAFYLFPRVDGLADSLGFCKRLLAEERVGLAPGCAFGRGGEGSVRLCYAAERHLLEDALERLSRFLSRA